MNTKMRRESQREYSEDAAAESKIHCLLLETPVEEKQDLLFFPPENRRKPGFEQLNEHILKELSSFMRLIDQIPRVSHRFFQPVLREAQAAKPLLKAVVMGNPEALIEGIRKNRHAFFMENDVRDPSGRIFYRVTAAKMIVFLCDEDMKTQVKCHIEETLSAEEARAFIRQWIAQVQEMGQGGADLVKVDRDPETLTMDEIRHFRETYPLFKGISQEVRYTLLRNRDGLIYYKNENNHVHWYYVNQETQTMTPVNLEPIVIPEDLPEKEREKLLVQQQAYENLIVTMDAMPPRSARRSSNAEHQVIAKTMRMENKPVELVREGIQYECNKEHYCDSRHDFNHQYYGYRECLRLYNRTQWNAGDKVFCEKLYQVEVIWLLQRICEKRPFYPLSDFKSSPFKRELTIDVYNRTTHQFECITVYDVNLECFIPNFGSDFVIGKGSQMAARRYNRCDAIGTQDFMAINRLIEEATATIARLDLDEDLTHQGIRLTR